MGVAADLSHIESAAQVKGYVGDSQLEECLQGKCYHHCYIEAVKHDYIFSILCDFLHPLLFSEKSKRMIRNEPFLSGGGWKIHGISVRP